MSYIIRTPSSKWVYEALAATEPLPDGELSPLEELDEHHGEGDIVDIVSTYEIPDEPESGEKDFANREKPGIIKQSSQTRESVEYGKSNRKEPKRHQGQATIDSR